MANWYYVIGDDQHGPVGDDDIRRMIASGELQADDLLWQAGMSDWVEVSEVFPAQGAAAAPSEDIQQPVAAYPKHESDEPVLQATGAPDDLYGPSDIQQEQPVQSAQPYMPVTDRGHVRPMPGGPTALPSTGQIHPLAIASIVLAIAGFFTCISAIPAIVVGHIALAQIKREPERYGGQAVAIAGLVIGYGITALMVLFFLLVVLSAA